MRKWPVILIVACLAAGPVSAGTANTDRLKACAAQWRQLKEAGRDGGQSYQQFCSTYLSEDAAKARAQASDHRQGAAPQTKGAPSGATARCKDGSYTTTPRRKPGACSGHGGVAAWLG